MNENIRAVIPSDMDGLKMVIESSQLFPPELLDDMIHDFFINPGTTDIWFTYIEDDAPAAVGYCIQEKLTEGTYNLLAIGVTPVLQGTGIATAMMNYLEQTLRQKGGRVLLVETSTDPAQDAARNFYKRAGYTEEATIRDFWKEGEHKIVFWKKL